MNNATTLVIPTKCDVEMGKNWASASEEKEQPAAAEGDFWAGATGSEPAKKPAPQRRKYMKIVKEMF
jgi:hypothetical protein